MVGRLQRHSNQLRDTGDFYDAELTDGNIGLVIADVCDKGCAALFMTLFRLLVPYQDCFFTKCRIYGTFLCRIKIDIFHQQLHR
jgi:hypothetical protein